MVGCAWCLDIVGTDMDTSSKARPASLKSIAVSEGLLEKELFYTQKISSITFDMSYGQKIFQPPHSVLDC